MDEHRAGIGIDREIPREKLFLPAPSTGNLQQLKVGTGASLRQGGPSSASWVDVRAICYQFVNGPVSKGEQLHVGGRMKVGVTCKKGDG